MALCVEGHHMLSAVMTCIANEPHVSQARVAVCRRLTHMCMHISALIQVCVPPKTRPLHHNTHMKMFQSNQRGPKCPNSMLASRN